MTYNIIASDAFVGCDIVIHCSTNSYACEWAKVNGYKWTNIEESTSEEETTNIEENTTESETFDDIEWVYQVLGDGTLEIQGGDLGDKKEIIIPAEIDGKKVTGIGDRAFSFKFSDATSIRIPDGVTRIGDYAFYAFYTLESINIPDGVTSIGEGAFNDCRELSVVEIPTGVREIEYATFLGCRSLTSIKMPDGITRIGDYAFGSCSGLSSIEIPVDVMSVGDYAFWGCSGLSQIEIPTNVQSIGEYAFSGCSGLSHIEIPAKVCSIGDDAFSGCSGLMNIEVSFENEYYLAEEGILYDKEKTSLLKCPAQKQGSVKISDGVRRIGVSAFSGCSGLSHIEIPSGVTSIADSVFSGCSGLSSIEIPSGVTSIGSYAFSGCSGLSSIEISSGVTNIGIFAFSGCSGLRNIEIPLGVTRIADYTFQNCSGLSSVEIPLGVVEIEDGAFSGCRSLNSIKIPSGVTSIGWSPFSGCDSLEIYCSSGSYACEWAEKNGYTWKEITTEPETTIESESSSKEEESTSKQEEITTDPESSDKEETTSKQEESTIEPETSSKEKEPTSNQEESTTEPEESSKEEEPTSKQEESTTEPESSSKEEETTSKQEETTTEPESTDKEEETTTEPEQTKKEITDVRLYSSTYPYDGSAKKPKLVVKVDGNALVEGVDYIVVYTDNVNAGTAKVTVSGIRDYAGTVTKTFTIQPIKITSVSIASSTYTYSGTAKKPSVTVKAGTRKLTVGKDYKVTYKNNVNPGTASVIVTGAGNYTGTITRTFNINLQKVANLKQNTNYATSKITMTWNKVKGADGYAIYRASTKNGSYKYLKSVSTNTVANAGLKAGSKYYYKTRAYKTVNGKKIYGAYSDAKSMLTKPATPASFAVTINSKTAKITWAKVTGAQGYEIYMSFSRNGSYTRIKNAGASTTSYNKTGLAKGKKYYFKMRAYTKTGTGVKVYSGYSKIKAVTVK